MPTPLDIERYKVDSSNIKSVGYADGVLVVEFKNGHLFAYDCTPEQFEAFAAAESKGRYYSLNIRGKLPSRKLTSRCGVCGSEPEIVGQPCSECASVILPMDSIHRER